MSGPHDPLLEVVSGDGDEFPEYMDMAALVKNEPTRSLTFIKEKGMRKLGTFDVQDETILKALNGRNMLTLGADSPDIDYETVWREQLDSLAPGSPPEWGARIKVSAYVCTIKNAAAPDVKGLLHPLLRRFQAGNLSDKVFSMPAVAAVINFKWDWFAFRLLLWEMAFFVTWLLSFNVFVVLFQDENPKLSLTDLVATTKGLICVVCHGISLVAMLPFLIIEASTMSAYLSGWLSLWNMMDMVTYVNQIIIVCLHLGRTYAGSYVLTVVVSLQCVLMWFRLQYFSRVFKPTKFSFVDGLAAAFDFTKWYFFFSMLIMWGFGMAFYTLYRLDQQKTDEFDTIASTMCTMFTWMMGGADLGVVQSSSEPNSALALALVYQFVMALVLLNLILGVMMNAVTKVDENQNTLYYCSKAQVTDELESTLPPFMERLLGCLNPPFVHVLKVDKDKTECLEYILGDDNQNVMEEHEGEDEEDSDKEDGGKNVDNANLAADMAELKQMVADLTAIVKAQAGAAARAGSATLKTTPSKKASK